MLRYIIPLLAIATAHGELTFETKSKEIHADADAKELFCDFSFENKTDKEQEIASFVSNCTCIAAQLSNGGKRIYQPGEKGVLRAVFQMGNFSGAVDKQVLIRMKDDPEDAPSVTLNVRVHIPTLVELTPKTVEWGSDEALEPKVIKVEINHTSPINVTGVSVSNPQFSVSLKEVTKGKSYEVIVTPDPKMKGKSGMTIVHVDTDCTIEKQKKQMAFAIMRHKLDRAPIPQAQAPKKP